MRRKTNAEFRPRHWIAGFALKVRSDLWRQPWIGRRQSWPSTLIETAKHHQLSALQPRFEEAPNVDSGMTAKGLPQRLAGEELTEHRHSIVCRHFKLLCSVKGLDVSEQF